MKKHSLMRSSSYFYFVKSIPRRLLLFHKPIALVCHIKTIQDLPPIEMALKGPFSLEEILTGTLEHLEFHVSEIPKS